MKVGDLITLLRAYPNDDEIEIQVFETNSGELIDSTSAIGIVEEDIFGPTFSPFTMKEYEGYACKTLPPANGGEGKSLPIARRRKYFV